MPNNDEELSGQSKSHVIKNSPILSVAFIHNVLDEYGLDPYEFRLYAHIVRRTGGKPEGVCFASLSKIAKTCKMSMRKAQQSLKFLIKAQLVIQKKRKGRTDEYRVTLYSSWVLGEELDKLRLETSKPDTEILANSNID
jgi:predicted transcriptional regulator